MYMYMYIYIIRWARNASLWIYIIFDVISHLMKHTIREGRGERAGKFCRESLKGKTEEEGGGKKTTERAHGMPNISTALELVPAPDTNKYVGVSWEVI